MKEKDDDIYGTKISDYNELNQTGDNEENGIADNEDLTNYVPKGDILDELVSFFTIFADNTRLRILSSLAIYEMTVTELSTTLHLNQSTVSHQLRTLKDLSAVKCVRRGKNAYYSLKNEMINEILLKAVICLGY